MLSPRLPLLARYRCVFYLMLPFSGMPLAQANTENYTFDASLRRGSVLSNRELNQFNQQDTVAPGRYPVDLFINGVFFDRDQVDFIRRDNQQVHPCFDRAQLVRFGLKNLPESVTGHCGQVAQTIKDIIVHVDMPQLRVDLSIPQALLAARPRGSINAAILDHGESMAFINYNLNQYHVSYRHSQLKGRDSTYASINGGVNLGLWRYRQQSSYRHDNDTGSRWDTRRRYVQRAILPWRSEILLGEGFTDGHFFSGVGFRGIQLTSDERMLPDSLRGYAPMVQGIARSNAKVTIRQGNSTLYETTVAPGPFTINDLYATDYAGDLIVVVEEADGSLNTFTVPFSAVPESIRPGFSRYSAIVGCTRYVGDNDVFTELTWQHGLNNTLTLNSGGQLADGYQALMLGGVYSNMLGAFGLDTTYSFARLPEGGTSGWMMHLSYSRTFSPTDTTLSVAGYRYSTAGFRDLNDVFGVRYVTGKDESGLSGSSRQRSRFDISVNQGLASLGNLMISASTQDYRDARGRDNQLQLGWGKTFGNGVVLNLSVTRTRSLEVNTIGGSNGLNSNAYNGAFVSTTQTVTALSLSFPLGRSLSAPDVSLATNHSKGQGSNYQSVISGSAGIEQPVSYGLNFSTDDHSKQHIWGGNLQTRLPYTNVTGSVSSARQYWQGSLGLQGAVVGHRGGVTLGPNIGDTFALIEAPGAHGAQVMGVQGAQVDRFGYALAPALIPYRYNSVALNPQGMSNKTELEDGQQRVAPYAGAMVRLHFRTQR